MECYFCQKNIRAVNFKDEELLLKFMSRMYKIKPKKKTGTCSTHQRKLARAIKRARQLALIPYAHN